MPSLSESLSNQESIRRRIKPHILSFLAVPALATLPAIISLTTLLAIFSPSPASALIIGGLILFTGWIDLWLLHRTTEYLLTQRQVMQRQSFWLPYLNEQVTHIPLSDIQTITIKQHAIQRYLDSGDVLILAKKDRDGVAQSALWRNVADPQEIKALIQKEISALQEPPAQNYPWSAPHVKDAV